MHDVPAAKNYLEERRAYSTSTIPLHLLQTHREKEASKKAMPGGTLKVVEKRTAKRCLALAAHSEHQTTKACAGARQMRMVDQAVSTERRRTTESIEDDREAASIERGDGGKHR